MKPFAQRFETLNRRVLKRIVEIDEGPPLSRWRVTLYVGGFWLLWAVLSTAADEFLPMARGNGRTIAGVVWLTILVVSIFRRRSN